MDSSSQIEVSIIVPAHNEEKTISDCLNSLLAQNYPRDRYEIIVVNDGSADTTESIVKALAEGNPHLILVSKPNGGKGSAQNVGLKYARGNLVLVTDADTVVPTDWVSRMAEELEEVDVALGGCYLDSASTNSIVGKIQNAQYIVTFKYGGFKGTPRSGANFGFKKKVAHDLEGFNESVIAITSDFVQRARKKGYKIGFNPEITVQTRGTSSLTQYIKQKLRWRELPLSIMMRKVKPSWSDVIGIGYTHGLSLALLAFTIAAVILLDFRYLLAPFVSIFLIDILLYIKPIYRLWKDGVDRSYIPYFLAQSLLVMLVRFILIPYLAYRLLRGGGPVFEPQRT